MFCVLLFISGNFTNQLEKVVVIMAQEALDYFNKNSFGYYLREEDANTAVKFYEYITKEKFIFIRNRNTRKYSLE